MTNVAIQVICLSAVFAVFYLVLVRPQQVRLRRHREMLGALRAGDRVATVGGVVGTIADVVDDSLLTLDAGDGVRLTVTRKSVDALLPDAEACTDISGRDSRRRAA